MSLYVGAGSAGAIKHPSRTSPLPKIGAAAAGAAEEVFNVPLSLLDMEIHSPFVFHFRFSS